MGARRGTPIARLKAIITRRGNARTNSESGDTLVEVLLALVVLGLASVALIIAFQTSISASSEHRNLATDDTVLATASQEIISAIQNDPSLFTAACTSGGQPIAMTNYPDYSATQGFPLPSPYTNVDVQYQTLNTLPPTPTYPVKWWNGTTFGTTCEDNEPQLITISLVGTTYTNSFVVDFPAGNSGGSSGSSQATQLVFLNQGSIGGTSYAGSPLAVQPIVAVETSNGAVVTTDYSDVTLTINSGTGVLSNCSGNEILGVTTFSGCTIGTGGTFTLAASDASIDVAYTPPVSNSFTVITSSFHLAFQTSPTSGQPVGAASGSAFATDPIVDVLNSSNSLDTSWTGTITFTLSGGQLSSSCLGWQSNTVVTVTATSGVATLSTNCDFSGGYFYNPNSSPSVSETQYTMTVTANPTGSSGTAVPAISNAFSVSGPGPASQLAFVVEPAGVASSSATTAFPVNPTVEVEDAYGNIEPTFSGSMAVSMFQGTTYPGTSETLNGCTPSFSNGIYTLTNCSGTKDNNNLELYATGSYVNASHTTVQLTPATSTPFNITGVATQLTFAQQPMAGRSGSALTTQPILVYLDASGNVVTAATAAISGSAPAGGTLSSCTNLVPNLGYVDVSNCTFAGLDSLPNTYYLVFTGGGITSPHSNYIEPTGPGPASQLAFVSPQPVAGAADALMTTQPTVRVEDSAGNNVTTSNISIAFSSTGNGQISDCTDLTALAGTVTAQSCVFGGSVATTYNLIASSGSLTSGESGPIQVTGPGPLSQIVLSTGCMSPVTQGVSCQLTAVLQDNFGNTETADNASVVTFAGLPTTVISGLGSATVSAGVANETVLAANAGSDLLTASADGVTSNTLPITVNGPPSITTTSLPGATQTGAYSQTMAGTGGTTPYNWTITGGSLPTGLTLNASTGVISGTVGASAVSETFTVTLTDADGVTATKSLTITVNAAPSITTTTLPAATQTQTTYSQTLAVSGGTSAFTWSVSAGTLPTGLTLNASTGVISGTVGASATSQTFTVKVVDANGVSATKSLTITVNAKPSITPATLPSATKTGAYSQTLSTSGGTTPFGAWSITSGSLPAGLTLNTSTGVISGTVLSTAVSETFTISITDANGVAATQTYTVTVNAAPSITTTTLPGATQTGAYSQTVAGTGGTTPYAWSVTTGILPSGLTLNASTGVISGTVGAGAVSETFTVTLTDANGVTATKSLTITVNAAPSITTTTLPAATQTQTTYSQTLAVSGGTSAFTWSVSAGTLPTGLTLNASTGVISGTVGASATSQTFTVKVVDANGVSATKSLTITVNAKPSITPATLPSATKTGAYSQTLSTSGGTTPFGAWSITSGSLPAGLTLNTSTGVISGTVLSTAVSETFTISITDANGVAATQTYTVTVNAAPSITTTTLPGATQTGAYSQTVAGTGGTTPYAWSVTTGILPSGLTLNASTGVISGTVGAGAVSETFTVTLTDANGVTATKSLTITVNAAPSITTTTLPAATQTQTTYSQTLAVSGGTSAFTWSVSAGTLPTGLTLNASTGVISGTVGASATSQTFTVKVVDANGVSATQALTLTVNASPNITTTTLPGATKGGTYSQTLAVTGGTAPLTWSLSTGTLPTGLTLNAATGVISGTVGSTAVSETFTVKVVDTNGVSDTQSLTITVNAAPSITTTTLATATQTETGYSQTVAGTGGTTPYTWSVTTGILPSGLTLNASTGVISGTVGASAVSETFTVTLTDADSVTATKSLTITVNAAPNITTTALATATQTQTGYSQTLAVSGGTSAFTWSVTTGILPSGLTLNASTGVISGTVGASAVSETFTVKVVDANGVSDTKSLTITVNAAPNITTTALATATQTQTGYSQTLAVTGGTAPLTWSVSVGTLPTGLTLNASTGVISGTVGASAVSESFTVKVVDTNGVSDTQALTLTVNTAPSITTTTLLGATKTGAYSQTLAGTGGTPPYAWSVTTGILPTGLTLNASTGVISGTVGSTAVSETFTVTLTDVNGVTATKSLTITVNAAPSITTTTLATATQTETGYAQTVAGTGGTTPYTWSVTTGILPSGLTLNPASGVISGTVGASAVSETFTVTLTDADGVTATKSLTITVYVKPSITTTSLAAATQNQTTYSQTVAGTGGATPYAWSVTTGILPSGLTLNASTGVISGTVGASAVSETFTVQLLDADAVTATKSLTITVNGAPNITTTTLPGATISGTYSQTLAVANGTTPFAWSVTTGILPSGLTLNASTGVISGTVGATAVSETFTVQVVDTNGVSDTQSLTITVNAKPSITTTTLPGATQTGAYSQTVAGTGGTTPYAWSVTTGILPTGLTLNASTGVISGTVGASAVSETFTVTLTDADGVTATKSLTITVNAAPNITTTTLPNGVKGNAYSQTLAVSGGTSAFTWSVSVGTLPTGLTLNASTGVISGTVSNGATSKTFTVKVVDANGVSDTQSLTITIT